MEGMGDSYSELMQRLQSSLGTCSANKSARKCSSFSFAPSQTFTPPAEGFSHLKQCENTISQTAARHLPPIHSHLSETASKNPSLHESSESAIPKSPPYPATDSSAIQTRAAYRLPTLDFIKKELTPAAADLSKDIPPFLDVSMEDQEGPSDPLGVEGVNRSFPPSNSTARVSENEEMDMTMVQDQWPPKRQGHRRALSDIPYKFVYGMADSSLEKVVRDIDGEIAKELMVIRSRGNAKGEPRSGWNMELQLDREASVKDSLGADPKGKVEGRGSTDSDKGGDADVDGGEDLFSMYIDMEKLDSFDGVADQKMDLGEENGDAKHVKADECKRKKEVLEERPEDDKIGKLFGTKEHSETAESLGLQLGKMCNQYKIETEEMPSGKDFCPVGNANNQALPNVGAEQKETGSFTKDHIEGRRTALTENGGSQHVCSNFMGNFLENFQSIKGEPGRYLTPLCENRRVRHFHSNSMDGNTDLNIKFGREEQDDWIKKVLANDKLAEIALVDPKRAKRILANRQSAARSKERKMKYISELEHKVQTLQTEATALSAQLTRLQRESSSLTNVNSELKLRLQVMEQQAQLCDALNDALREEVQRLKLAVGQINGIAMGHLAASQQLFQVQQHHLHKRQQNQNPRGGKQQSTHADFLTGTLDSLQEFAGASYKGSFIKSEEPDIGITERNKTSD